MSIEYKNFYIKLNGDQNLKNEKKIINLFEILIKQIKYLNN